MCWQGTTIGIKKLKSGLDSMKIVMLSEGDSAGSGSRISESINKHCKDIDATFVVKRAKRKKIVLRKISTARAP